MNARTRTIAHYAVAMAAGMVVFLLIALPTCITVSYMSPHPWWGVLVTIPVCLIGFYLGAFPAVKKVLGWFEVREEQRQMLEEGRALAAEMEAEDGPVTEAELLELRKVWPRDEP